MILGNKCDMEDKRVVETERGKKLAEEYGIEFFETSAKDSTNVELSFLTMVQQIKRTTIDTAEPIKQGNESVKVGNSQQPANTCPC